MSLHSGEISTNGTVLVKFSVRVLPNASKSAFSDEKKGSLVEASLDLSTSERSPMNVYVGLLLSDQVDEIHFIA